jgi:hypothetical protein
MKSLIGFAIVVALIVPLQSHAVEAPLTHAQVRAELIQLEEAGYNPLDENDYPRNLKHAQTIVAQRNAANSAYGSNAAGTSQSSGMERSGEK